MTTTDARKRRAERRSEMVEVPRAILTDLAEALRDAGKSHAIAGKSFKGLAAYVDSLADD